MREQHLQATGSHAQPTTQWVARLNLEFASRHGTTYPCRREHSGPLRILKGFPATSGNPDLYEQIVVHPPGGIAAGDQLHLNIHAAQGAHILMTSPGAAKWYRNSSPDKPDTKPLHTAQTQDARQTLNIHVGHEATVEWLPMENIIFNGSRAVLDAKFNLHPTSALVSADVFCLGRPVCDEAFDTGMLRASTEIRRNDRLLFTEKLRLNGSDRILKSRAGLNGASAFGTLIAIPPLNRNGQCICPLDQLRDAVRKWWNQNLATKGMGMLVATALPDCLVVRWFGDSAEAGWHALRGTWQAVRKPIIGIEPDFPRIWHC